jgi:hypothetical protein
VVLDLEEDFIVVVGYFDVQMFALSCSAACVSPGAGLATVQPQFCEYDGSNRLDVNKVLD